MGGVKNLGNGWSKSNVLEDKVSLNFDFRYGAKKSGHCKVIPDIFQYISVFYEKAGFLPAKSKTKLSSSIKCIGMFLAFGIGMNAGTPSKRCFFQKI